MNTAIDYIIQEVCEQFVLTPQELLDRKRTAIKVSARTAVIMIALAKEYTLVEVGTALGNMHHASVIYLRDQAGSRFHQFEHHRPAFERSLKAFSLL